ncbi:MAG: GNAT family N-acetyltransferase [Chitinophagaceae bacterium]|nr:GNAT family N-acetyltransferase [Chitinophagaceae bacterium]
MTEQGLILPASGSDYPAVVELLVAQQLPFEDIDVSLDHFMIVKQNDHLIAVGAIELHQPYALLRSVATHPHHRGKKLATRLIHQLLAEAKGNGVKSVFLLTTTAREFFLNQGFSEIDRNSCPAEIASSTEFQSICPSSAILMQKEIL